MVVRTAGDNKDSQARYASALNAGLYSWRIYDCHPSTPAQNHISKAEKHHS